MQNKLPSSSATDLLIVDDERSILDSLKDIIEIENPSLNIATARSGEEAISYMMQNQVSILLTDLKLPGISGVELLENLAFVSPDTKAILMTAYGYRAVRSLATASGCRGYLEKPFEVDKLLNHISSILYSSDSDTTKGESLTDSLKAFATQEKTGVLQIFCPQGSGHITLKNGTVIDSKFEDLNGAEALLRLLCATSTVITALPSPNSSNYKTVIPARVLLTVLTLSSTDERRMYLQNQLPYLYRNTLAGQSSGDNLSSSSSQQIAPEKSDIEKFLMQGMRHYRAKRYEEAKFCWNSALKLDPTCKEAPIYLSALKGLTLT
jgi:YesN/AraC family two-component response regulator